jgi:hypothetical protein
LWLAKGPPRTTAVQEGLPLVEIFTFRSTPRRAKKLNDRILAVDKAEDGASFLDVFEWYGIGQRGTTSEECFQNTRRVFRGGLMEGGAPFTRMPVTARVSRSTMLHVRRHRGGQVAAHPVIPLRRQGGARGRPVCSMPM